MIDRALVGKAYPAFAVIVSAAFRTQLWEFFRSASSRNAPSESLLSNWQAILALHATAYLTTVWEDMRVDPLGVRLVSEEFAPFREPRDDEELSAQVRVEDISQRVEPDTGLEEQVDLLVDFRDPSQKLVANYRTSYRIPVASRR
jgi:hypothetical protein